MQAQQTQRRNFNFEKFYKECGDYPEIPKFRNFGDRWTKKLYDDVAELKKREQRLDIAIGKICGTAGLPPLKFLECPRWLIIDEATDETTDNARDDATNEATGGSTCEPSNGSANKDRQNLKAEWCEWENLLRSYSQDLHLYSKLHRLPNHAPYFSKRLNGYWELFENGDFGPTDERGVASEYRNVEARGFVSVVGNSGSDTLTNLLTAHIEWIDRKILRRIQNIFNLERETHANGSYGVEHETIGKTLDALTCLFVPFILTSTMFALASTSPLMARIAVVGGFGLVFAISAKLISGKMSRGEIFSYSAAFFAVASVFVSTTNESVSGSS